MLSGIASVLIGQFFGSTVIAVGTKIGLAWATPVVFVFLRFLFAALFIFPVLIFSKKVKIAKKDVIKFMILGLFLGANVILFSFGVQYTTVIMSQILYLASPVVVGIIAHFFLNERLTSNKIIGMVIAIFGVFLLLYKSVASQESITFGKPIGNIMILAAMLGYSGWVLYSRAISKTNKHTTYQMTFFTFLFISLYAFILIPIQFIFSTSNNPLILPEVFLSSLIVGAGTVIQYFLLQVGIKRTNAFTVSILQYSGPFFAGIISIPLLHEKVSLFLIFGGLLIAIGVFYATSFTYFKKKFPRDSIKL